MNKLTTNRSALRKIKKVSRAVEMAAESGESGITGGKMLQFVRDVQIYGLYEACLYLKNGGVSEEKIDEIVDAAL